MEQETKVDVVKIGRKFYVRVSTPAGVGFLSCAGNVHATPCLQLLGYCEFTFRGSAQRRAQEYKDYLAASEGQRSKNG